MAPGLMLSPHFKLIFLSTPSWSIPRRLLGESCLCKLILLKGYRLPSRDDLACHLPGHSFLPPYG